MANPITSTYRNVVKAVAGAAAAVGFSPAAWTMDGLIPFSWPLNYWQTGRDPITFSGPNAAVEACVSAISQSVAMMPAAHWRKTPDGGREQVTTSPAHRVLRRPNAYQTRAELMVNLLRCVLLQGNGYGQARRDSRNQIYELHLAPPRSVGAYIDPQSGAVFYQFGGNPILDAIEFPTFEFDPRRVIPARDVLHLRLHSGKDPLRGVTPLTSAAYAVAGGNAIAMHNAAFFGNMSRPSGVLSTEQKMPPQEIELVRSQWTAATTAQQTGGVPLLTSGLKWQATSMTAADAALIESYKLTVADIARVFRVPPPIIGDLGGATFSNTETLLRHWIATGLGFVIEQLEACLDFLFSLPDGEWIEFDTDYLLRSEFAARVEALTRGIGGGLFAPNEARAKEGLPAKTGGDTVYVQQQLQRLEDRANNLPLDAGRPPPPAPPPPPEPAPPPTAAQQDEAAKEAERIIREVMANESVS